MPQTLTARIQSAVTRRARRAWRAFVRAPLPDGTERALDWLLEHGRGDGVSETAGEPQACPGLTAAAIAEAFEFGQREAVRRWTRWLLSTQRADGAFPDVGLRRASDFNTALALSALLAVEPEMSEVRPAARRAAEYLASKYGSEEQAARELLRAPSFTADARGGSTSDLAALATIWYRRGERRAADRALDWVARLQRPSGGFPERCGPGVNPHNQRESAWTAIRFLTAQRTRVETSFRPDTPDVSDRIDPADGRVAAVEDWFRRLGPASSMVDIGCGRGSYLRHLRTIAPQVRLTGADLSAEFLASLPAEIESKCGSLLRLPLADHSFDGALAVESLEHSLVPRQAVAEMCRVVRPGGWLLIIDKHQYRQSLSLCEPWERWFTPHEVCGWLSHCCEEISVTDISHGVHPGRSGLFLAWTARRRTSSA